MATTRVLVGVAARALEELGDEVTLSQFRLLVVLREHGPATGIDAAERLGAVGSSVTRLADRLEESGHLTRRRERPNRSVVRLELTAAGRALVDRVLTRRRAELGRIVASLTPDDADRLTTALDTFLDAAGTGHGHGPVELRAL